MTRPPDPLYTPRGDTLSILVEMTGSPDTPVDLGGTTIEAAIYDDDEVVAAALDNSTQDGGITVVKEVEDAGGPASYLIVVDAETAAEMHHGTYQIESKVKWSDGRVARTLHGRVHMQPSILSDMS